MRRRVGREGRAATPRTRPASNQCAAYRTGRGRADPARSRGAASPGAASTGTVDLAARRELINDVSAKQREYEQLVSEFGRLDPRVDAALAAFKEANARLAESAGYRG